VRAGSSEEALKRAYRFLSYRPRSEEEIRSKLRDLGFPNDVIETTVERLRSLNLVNDDLFARGWVRRRTEGRGYGPLRLERELRQKGIAKALIDQILRGVFGQEEGKERARTLLEKRFKGQDLSRPKTLRRAVAFLQRRGYRDSVITGILRQPSDD